MMPNDDASHLVDIVRKYFAAIETGDPEANLQFFAADVVQEEFPNRLVPNGAKRDLAALREAAQRGKKVMVKQRYELLNAVAHGDQVAVEARWIGALAVPFGSLPAGGEMTARFAIFLEFRDGRIVRQRNYDCFDPF